MSETDSSAPGRNAAICGPAVPDDERLVHEETVDFGGPSELAVTIVEAVASVRGVPPTELVPTIQEAIDPDGLAHLFRDQPTAPERLGWVTFFFAGCRVVVESGGLLRVFAPSRGR